MPTNTSLTARDSETYQLLLTSPDGSLKLWHDQGETPGYKIEHRVTGTMEVVWYRAPTRYQWRKDRADAERMAHAMAADLETTMAPPAKATGARIQGKAPAGPEDREKLAMLGRMYGEHVEMAFGEEPAERRRR